MLIKGLMTGKRLFSRCAVILLGSLLCLMLSSVASQAAEAIGRLTAVAGRVDILRGGRLPAIAARKGDAVFEKDFVRTKSRSRAEIRFSDGNVIRIAPRSRIDVSEYAVKRDRRSFRLSRGRIEAVVTKATATSRSPRRFEISTPNAVAGVRGTWYFVYFDNNATGVAVKEGVVYVYNLQHPEQMVELPAGFSTLIRNGNPPDPSRPATQGELTLVRGGGASGGDEGTPGQLAGVLWVPDGNPPPSFMAPLSDTNPAVLGPAVEVGVANLAWDGGTFTDLTAAAMNNVHFLAPAAGGTPTAFRTDANSISMDYINLVSSPVNKSVNFTNGNVSTTLTINSWNMGMTPGSWSGSVSGSGNINGPFTMSGTATGTVSGTATGTGAQYGVATGTASGTATPQ